MEQRTCPVCREPFAPRAPNQRFCCKQHGKAYENATKRGTLDQLLARGGVGQPFDCAECGNHCVPGQGGVAAHARRFCGHECKTIKCKREWHQANRTRRYPSCRARPGPKVRAWICGECPECGKSFIARATSKARFCSRKCLARTAKRKRRALMKGAGYKTLRFAVIVKRDGWLCQLCGEPVDRMAKAPHPLSPTLDHIVPLSLGGTHSEDNAQLAHFLCNSRKGDGTAVSIGGQMSLV